MSTKPRIRTKSISNQGRRVGRECVSLLDGDVLVDDTAVATAIYRFERHIFDPSVDLHEMISEMALVPHLLEFVFSATDDYSFEVLHDNILQGFPHTPEAFEDSLSSRLLNRFSISLLFLQPDAATDTAARLAQHRRAVELAAPLLKALTTLQFGDEPLQDDISTSPVSPTKRRSQHQRKQSIRASRTPIIDPRPFTNYGVSVPTSKSSAAEVSSAILEEHMSILKYYLDIFRNPELAPLLKDAYLPPAVPEVQKKVSDKVEMLSINSTQASTGSGAYPFVQPMKAALYFDSAKGFGQWRILLSNGAAQDLRQARRKDRTTFKIIINKIKDLSHGHFSEDNQKRLTGMEVQVPIYEAKMTRNTRLVYQVDCVPEFESDVERQVLRIFGIYTHEQLDHARLWDGIGWQLARKGADYRKRCNYRRRPANQGGDVFIPGSWPPLEGPAQSESTASMWSIVKEDLEQMHSLLVLEKFVTFSQALLNSILADQDVTHVFDVSPQEKRIIEHPSSCYVLGRSGTGKTTTMLFKMLGIERSWDGYRDTLPKPRQLFVTQSRVLAEKVEEYFGKLLESLLSANHSNSDVADIVAKKRRQQEQGLVDKDEEVWHRGDIPKRFGELTDEHFPMFLTYHQLCRLLESEFQHLQEEDRKSEAQAQYDAMERREPADGTERWSSDHIMRYEESFVSEAVFLREYWAHFPQALTKGLDPTLVFSEFMGVIKGSKEALRQPQDYLDEETYCNLSSRTQSTFASQRQCIYRLFLAYLKRKKMRGDWDVADRTHALIRSLRGGVPGQELDFLYVDEAQDNLLIDALVLRTMCRNPHGLFWAGDTAQTISAGSAFRFNDLKDFLYGAEEATAVHKIKRVQPESFQLAVNYRSHAGIINCAQTVIKLITEFWPYAIDTLAEEKGMIDGTKPVFVSGWDQESMRYEQFLFGESRSHIEFGAQQCILVRDDTARDKLRAQVGEIGLILTLYEAKGLEFNDVLLYNFFEDSTADRSQWRVVLNALPRDARAFTPRFDELRHNSICRELKFLYVAITRARKNLWIADSSEKGEPMRYLWTQKDQIQTCTTDTDVPKLAMSSSPEEWAATGLSLFNHRRYSQAMHCYERAGLSREKEVAHAYSLREQARSAPVNPRSGSLSQVDAYMLAASAFMTSAHDAVKEKRAYYRIAGECFVHCGDHYRAAEAYRAALEYDLAAQHYRKAGKFDEAVDVVKSHKTEMDVTVVESITEVSKLYFLREKEIGKARALFETDEDALEYMDDYGLNVARASLLEQLGQYAEAAEVLFEEGNTLEAARLLALDRGNQESVKRAVEVILAGLWSILSFGVAITHDLLDTHPTLGKLLEQVQDIDLSDTRISEDWLNEILMFQAITSRNTRKLIELSDGFLRRHNHTSALLCLDHAFTSAPKLPASLPAIGNALEGFLTYAKLLWDFASNRHPSINPMLCRLFNLQASTEDLFNISQDAFILSHASERFFFGLQRTEQGYVVPRWEVDNLVNCVLRERLRLKVNEENYVCHRLPALRPCLTYAAHLQCHREACPRYHGDLQYYTSTAYNLRVRIHILQMLIYHTVEAIEPFPERIHQKRFWLRQIHSTLFPAHHHLGSLHDLSSVAIPELQQGLQIMSFWTQDVLYSLEPWRAKEQFLTQLAQCAQFAFTLDRGFAARYLRKVRCVATFRPSSLMRTSGDAQAYVVNDLVDFLENDRRSSLNQAFLFLNFVIQTQVPIDITVLCDIIDRLCGCLVLATRGRSRQIASLHNVTLPKSWILLLAPHFHVLPSKDFSLSFLYSRNIGVLLERIFLGSPDAGHLLYENTSLSNIGFPIRNLFLARILKNLCLWGYNISAYTLRDEILRTITSLRRPDRTFPPIVEQYVYARNWEQLARVVRQSVSSQLSSDELVQFHHGSVIHGATSLPHIKHVVYQRLQDVPNLLGVDALGVFDVVVPAISENTSIPTRSAMVVSPPSEMQSHMDATSLDPVIPVPTLTEDGQKDDDIVHAVEPTDDLEDIARAIDLEQVNVGPKTPSAEEIAAATFIATRYRRYATRKAVGKKTFMEMKIRINTVFFIESHKMDWPHTFYRLLFLGPVPHLFAVVEAMKNNLYDAKNTAKKRLNLVQHLELENMSSSLTQTTRRFKVAHRLHQYLSPDSDLHKTRDVEKLKAYTREADALMKTFPEGVASMWREDMSIALRGIVEVRKVTKALKPELHVTNDVEDLETVYDSE